MHWPLSQRNSLLLHAGERERREEREKEREKRKLRNSRVSIKSHSSFFGLLIVWASLSDAGEKEEPKSSVNRNVKTEPSWRYLDSHHDYQDSPKRSPHNSFC